MTLAASSLVESFGCNVHFRYPSYVDKIEVLKARIKELGVRYLRDGLENSQTFLERVKDVNTATGARFAFIVEPRHYTVEQAHAMIINGIGVNRVCAIEGVNEADGWFDTQVGDWRAVTAAHQQALYQTMKGVAPTNAIPIYAPTVIQTDSAVALGDLSAFADFGNFHRYPGSRHPETLGWGGMLNGVKYGSLEYGLKNVANVITPGKPAVITESGYFSSGAGNYVNPEVMGRYYPRLLLHHLSGGIARTYGYELFDESPDKTEAQSNYGLIRNDGSAKPAFIALRNLFRVLSDSQVPFKPVPLELSLRGEVADVRTVLFQKSNGTYYLAYWLAKSSWDPVAFKLNNVPPQTVTLAGVVAAQWVCPRFNVKWEEAQPVIGGVQLQVTDHVRVARLTL